MSCLKMYPLMMIVMLDVQHLVCNEQGLNKRFGGILKQ
jgi:hypothetical protein